MINIQSSSLPSSSVVPNKLPLATLAFPTQSASLEFSFSDLLFDFSAPVTNIERTVNELIIKAKVNDYLKLVLILQGGVTEDNAYFQTKTGFLGLEQEQESTEANFVADSLTSIFALAGDITVALPSINLDINLYFDLPPKQISELLKKQRVAYQSMITEFSNTSGSAKPAWDSFIQELVNLEDKLDDLLFEKYNKLAEASLCYLSEEEKEAIYPRKETKE